MIDQSLHFRSKNLNTEIEIADRRVLHPLGMSGALHADGRPYLLPVVRLSTAVRQGR